MAALLASPTEWPHYFALAFIPIALLSPSLSLLWFVPLLAWLAPQGGHPISTVPYLAIIAILTLRLCVFPRHVIEPSYQVNVLDANRAITAPAS